MRLGGEKASNSGRVHVRIPATALAILAALASAFGGYSGSAIASPVHPGAASFSSGDSRVEFQESDGVSVWVPTYVQQRNLSCEYAALVIAMGAYGVWVSEYDFDGLVGWSDNPHWGYRGDITGWWGNTDDYGVYASALVPAVNAYGFWADEFYAQGDASALTRRIDAGAPVIVWLGLWGNTGFYEWTEDGSSYKLAPGMHVVVVYGYDSSGVYFSDPATGNKSFYDWGTFLTYWNVMDGMSLAIGPM
jgi:uncharacterized protein YvpB